MTKKTMMELALGYAARGWRIFPIVPSTKDRPMVKWGSEASSDPAVVRMWWTRTPDANIGCAVGQSGLAVVDLDDKKGKQGSKRWEELQLWNGEAPETLTSRTPSGGRHKIFSGECANTVGTETSGLADGVDTRGSGGMGGYVLLPGSRTEQGEYEWDNDLPVAPLPDWVREQAGKRREERPQRTDVEVEELDTPEALAWARNYLANDARPAVEGQGGNNRAFYVACVLRDRGLSEGASADLMAEHYNPRCEPPWSLEEIARFARNAWEYAGVVGPGGDSAEAHFGGRSDEDDWGKAGEPPSIEEFHAQGARPLVEVSDVERNAAQLSPDSADEPLLSFRDAWVWLAQQKTFMRRSDKFLLDEKGFDSLYGYLGEKGKIAQQILSSNGMMRKFETVAFLPGENEFAGKTYNTWVRPRVRPELGDTSPFDEHMERLLPDEVERGHALDWMAWVVQNERLKPNFMFLMQGAHGCGKSILGVLLAKMVDERNTTFLRTEDVGNRFNSWVLKTRLAVVEELMGDDKRTLANRLKALVTQDTVTVEMKGKDLINTPNRCSFMAFTNHMDALRLENGDRRYMVFQTQAKGRGPGSPTKSYWDRLWAFVRGDGPAFVLHQLMSREVDVGFGLGRAPATRGHEAMRREALPELERVLLEAFEDRNPPFDSDLVAVSDIEAQLPSRLQRLNGLHKLIPTFLRDEVGAVCLGPHRVKGVSASKRIWAIRRAELYQQMPASARVERYLRVAMSEASVEARKRDLRDRTQAAAEDFGGEATPAHEDDLPDPLA